MARTFLNKTNIPLNMGYVPNLEIRLFGNWEEAIRVVQNMSWVVRAASERAQIKICKDLLKAVKNHLINQDLGWTPLSEAYEKRKVDAGLGDYILLSTYTYYNNITVWEKGNQHMVFVGVKKGIYTKSLNGKKSKLEVAQIAAVHEFSSGKRVPKRPLWNPTIAEMGGAKGLKDAYLKSFIAHARVRGIPIKQFYNMFK